MYIKPSYIDNVLNSLKANCSQVIMCSGSPSSLSDAQSKSLGSSSVNLTIGNYSNGKKLTFNQLQITATANGVINQLVFVSGTDIEFISYIEPIPVQNGEPVTINSYDVWKIENLSF